MKLDVSLMRDVVTGVTQLLTNQGLTVTQRGAQAYVKPDKNGKPVLVNLPEIPDNASDELLLAIQGFLDHEVGHVLFTEFTYKLTEREADKKLHVYHNIVEDPLVEKLMGEKFPGSKFNTGLLHEFFLEKITEKALSEPAVAADPAKQFQIIMVPMMRALAGQKIFDEWMTKKGYWDHPFVKAVLAKLPADIRQRMQAMRNTRDSYEIATLVHGIMTTPPPPPPAMPEESEDEEQSDDKGAGQPSSESKPKDDESDPSEKDDQSKSTGDKDNDEESEPEQSEKDKKDDKDDSEQPESEDEADDDAQPDGDDQKPADEDADPDGGRGSRDEDDDGADDEPENDDGDDGAGEGSDDRSGGDGDGDDIIEEGSDGAGDADPDGDGDDADGDADGGKGSVGTAGGDEDAGEDAGRNGDEDGAEVSEADGGKDEDAGSPGKSNADHKKGKSGELGEEDQEGQAGIGGSEDLSGVETPTDLSQSIIGEITDQATRETRNAPYRVYSREWDRIETYEGPEVTDKQFQTFEHDIKAMIGPMQKDIERMMASRSLVMNTPGFRSGRLHGAALHKLSANDDRVFRRRFENKSKQTAVSLVIDNSGSMGGEKLTTAMQVAYALSQTLERVKIAHEVLGFTTGAPGAKDAPYSETVKIYDEIKAEESRIGGCFSRFDTVIMPIYKSFDERCTPEVRQRFASKASFQRDLGGNNDAESVEIAVKRLMKRREDRKVAIVLSDGYPAVGCNHSVKHHQHSHLHRVIANAEKNHIDLIGIGIMDDSVKSYYPKHVVINNVAELPTLVMREIKSLLTK